MTTLAPNQRGVVLLYYTTTLVYHITTYQRFTLVYYYHQSTGFLRLHSPVNPRRSPETFGDLCKNEASFLQVFVENRFLPFAQRERSIYLCIYIYIYIYAYIHIHVHIYIYIERERYRYTNLYIDIIYTLAPNQRGVEDFTSKDRRTATTVGFHNFNLRNVNLRVSNPNKLTVPGSRPKKTR